MVEVAEVAVVAADLDCYEFQSCSAAQVVVMVRESRSLHALYRFPCNVQVSLVAGKGRVN